MWERSSIERAHGNDLPWQRSGGVNKQGHLLHRIIICTIQIHVYFLQTCFLLVLTRGNKVAGNTKVSGKRICVKLHLVQLSLELG